jgi:ABC-2 type transport system ATP-binding protein
VDEGQEHKRRLMTAETPRMDDQNDDLLVQTSGLTKRYGSRITAVADLDLTVRRGEVYGFLGPNGSGKTTTLRMLLGLIRPTSGTARVLGKEPGDPAGLERIGGLVESPAFYPYLSGRDNLHVMASYAGVSPTRVDEVLETVELAGRAEDKVKKYSLGMKQRLGVAAALLKDPELLILDEPTNGLDPRGVADVRGIIRRVGGGERTVLLSSHLLGEVEQICDRIGIVREGRMISETPVGELRGREGLSIRVEPLEEALRAAEGLPGVEKAWVDDDTLRLLLADPDRAAEINAALVHAGLRVSELRPVERSLEEVFLQLTAGAGNDGER